MHQQLGVTLNALFLFFLFLMEKRCKKILKCPKRWFQPTNGMQSWSKYTTLTSHSWYQVVNQQSPAKLAAHLSYHFMYHCLCCDIFLSQLHPLLLHKSLEIYRLFSCWSEAIPECGKFQKQNQRLAKAVSYYSSTRIHDTNDS